MKPAYYYERQANEAKARDTYYRNKPQSTRPTGSTIEQRELNQLFYRSLFLKDGTDHRQFRVQVDSSAITKLGNAGNAGLTVQSEAGKLILPAKRNLKPTRASWYKGEASPTRKVTAWQSGYGKYYDSTGGRSHFSVPISSTGAAFDTADVVAKFNALFYTAAGLPNATLLGAKNGRAQLTLERVSTSVNT